jgi:hypothetical protein
VIIGLNSVIFPILHATFDFSYVSVVTSIPRQCILQLFLLLLVDKHIKNGSLLDNYFEVSIRSGVIYVLISIIMFLVPNIKTFWSAMIYQPSHNIYLSEISYYQTRWGLAGFSGFDCTLCCSIFIVMVFYLICKNIVECKKIKKKYYLQIIILLLGNVFYGRTGLIISMIVIIISTLFIGFKLKKLSSLTLLFIILCMAFGIMLRLKDRSEFVNTFYVWAFTPIRNLFTTGEIGTQSYNDLVSMHFMPNIKTLLIGDGYYTEKDTGLYYMHTDVGYLRPTLFYGVFNLIIGYICSFAPLLSFEKTGFNKSVTNLIAFLYISIVLICEYKGGTYYRVVGYFMAICLAAQVNQSFGKL